MEKRCQRCATELPKRRGWKFAKLCEDCWIGLLWQYLTEPVTLAALANEYHVSLSSIEQKLSYLRGGTEDGFSSRYVSIKTLRASWAMGAEGLQQTSGNP